MRPTINMYEYLFIYMSPYMHLDNSNIEYT